MSTVANVVDLVERFSGIGSITVYVELSADYVNNMAHYISCLTVRDSCVY